MSGVLIMKKKIVLSALIIITLLSFLLTICVAINRLFVILFLIFILYIVCVIGVVGLIQYRTYMSVRIIDPKKNLKRGYKHLYLGIYDGTSVDSDTLDLRGYLRNFYVDTLLVQRYYSFLCENGDITIFAGKNTSYINHITISVLDYPLLHPVTLLEHGLKPKKYLLYSPITGYIFLWGRFWGNRNTRKCSLNDKAANIIRFCKSRNVNLEIVEE